MKLKRVLPSNRVYAAFMVIVLLGSVTFLTVYISEGISEGTLTGLNIRSNENIHIVKKDGKQLLWASGRFDSEDAEWFDMTDSLINPRRFDHGIGKDTIPSIDAPLFVKRDDPRFSSFNLSEDTPVIGYAAEGEAKAYPIRIMNRHEIVNDTFGDTHLTVAW